MFRPQFWLAFGVVLALGGVVWQQPVTLLAEEPTPAAASSNANTTTQPAKVLPLPGETWQVQGHDAFLISHSGSRAHQPRRWVLYAPTLPGLPGQEERWMFEQFLAAGIAVAGIDVGESYGNRAGQSLYSALYQQMTEERGYASRVILLGRSRGGLMALAWARQNPEKVAGLAGIYPVFNLASYPGLERAAPAYGLTPSQLAESLAQHNPIDHLDLLAKQHVPIFAIHGDQDDVVPLQENSGLVQSRYAALGGSMQLIVPAGQGHNMWPGFFQSQPLVDFVQQVSAPALQIEQPRDYQVIQRDQRDVGRLPISIVVRGHTLPEVEPWQVQWRLADAQGALAWQALTVQWSESPAPPQEEPAATNQILTQSVKGRAEVKAPAGGWYQLEIRAMHDTRVMLASAVEHVGVGEVFVVAGQSNSANYGETPLHVGSGKVVSWDGRQWRMAHDPQPGAGGTGGSFIPPFGDALVRQYGVPVGFVACGVGATSIREWLPAGSAFPQPPTLLGNVRPLANGDWESTGALYDTFLNRLKSLQPTTFRAVLWHQGESDANQDNPHNTLPGILYQSYLQQLIESVRQDLACQVPWFVAQVSYHSPRDTGSEEIRQAQRAVVQSGLALLGPDSDALGSPYRDGRGEGVHFSAAGLEALAQAWLNQVAPWLDQQLK